MNISIIIPTYNKLSRLKLVVASLCNQINFNCNFEVIIIDDNSTDETENFIRQLNVPFALIYYKNKSQQGRAYSRNKGVQLSNYELIIFIDDDVILQGDFIFQHLLIQKKQKCIVHGRIMNLPYLRYFSDPSFGIFYENSPNKKEYSSLRKFCISEEAIWNSFNDFIVPQSKIASLEKIINNCLDGYPGLIDWIAFTGGNLSIPKAWFDAADGFDEKFGLIWGCEDLELGYRLFQKKFLFKYADNAINYHIVHYRANYAAEHQINAQYFFEKHNDRKIVLFQEFINKQITKDEFLAAIGII